MSEPMEMVPMDDEPMELSVQDVHGQVQKIQQLLETVMIPGEHYGKIPGCGEKDVLFKAGAEKLCLVFRLGPVYESESVQEGEHLSVKSQCTLYHIPTQRRVGRAEGYCTSKETKYAGRRNVADTFNTVLKMANKRSLVAAVLNATAASDIFTQDLEDQSGDEAPAKPIKPVKTLLPKRQKAPEGPSQPQGEVLEAGMEPEALEGPESRQEAPKALPDEAEVSDAELIRRIWSMAMDTAGNHEPRAKEVVKSWSMTPSGKFIESFKGGKISRAWLLATYGKGKKDFEVWRRLNEPPAPDVNA